MVEHWQPVNEERRTWFGANQPRPRLPQYLRTTERLKGLDEFETPEFVGRMGRVARRRRLGWYATFGGVVLAGVLIGWTFG
jgi:hypothetical protein